jgi:DNA polymerase/3'-5' exonuclease PolX
MSQKENIREVIMHLNILKKYYEEYEDDYHRARSFTKAIETLEESGVKFISNTSEISDLPGIGASTLKEVEEFISSRTSRRLETILENNPNFKSEVKEMILSDSKNLPSLSKFWQEK